MPHTPRLTPVPGGRHAPVRLAGVALLAAPETEPPFPVDVRMVEEDTWRILSPPPELPMPSEHPVRIMTDLIEDRPSLPGSVLVGRHQWRAVVYDLDDDPICREDWVAAAFEQTLRRARERGCRSLAVPLLGATHGPLTHLHALSILLAALRRAPRSQCPHRIWVQVGPPHLGGVVGALQDQAWDEPGA